MDQEKLKNHILDEFQPVALNFTHTLEVLMASPARTKAPQGLRFYDASLPLLKGSRPMLAPGLSIEDLGMDFRKADFMPQGLKYMLTTEDTDHTQHPALQSASSKTMTNSESSCMDPFQGQMNIISRLIDKCNYSVFNIVSTPPTKAGSVHYVKTSKQLWHLGPTYVRCQRLQSF